MRNFFKRVDKIKQSPKKDIQKNDFYEELATFLTNEASSGLHKYFMNKDRTREAQLVQKFVDKGYELKSGVPVIEKKSKGRFKLFCNLEKVVRRDIVVEKPTYQRLWKIYSYSPIIGLELFNKLLGEMRSNTEILEETIEKNNRALLKIKKILENSSIDN